MHYRTLIIVGARPNFMKAAPISEEFKKYDSIDPLVIHTGQHYDDELSSIFFDDLNLPEPDFYLGIGSGTHSEQSARVMMEFEKILKKLDPHLVVVVGDVNSTLACALATAKYRCTQCREYPLIAHVEAGLRSHDWLMPEEINRRLTDVLSDLMFTTEPSAQDNLLREGLDNNRIFYVGNVMIDTLLKFKGQTQRSKIMETLKLKPSKYAVLTLHRPVNVDVKENLSSVMHGLGKIARLIQIVFPIHPRTRKMLDKNKIKSDFLSIVPPLGYLDFLRMMINAKFVLTDSGGIQEETTVLNIPCLTIRENTERPVTVTLGTNTIVGKDPEVMIETAQKIMQGKGKQGEVPKFWDGKAAQRICKILYNYLKVHIH